MKTKLGWRALVIGLTTVVPLRGAQAPGTPGQPSQAPPIVFAALQGTVVRAGTTEPLADAKITVDVSPEMTRALRDAMQRGGAGIPPQILQALQAPPARGGAAATPAASPFSGVTDSAGHFFITVPEGAVTVHAQLDGYFGALAGGVSPPVEDTPAVVSARQPAAVHIELIPGGTVSGRVVDMTGKIIVEAIVGAALRTYRNGRSALEVLDARPTDDRGNYRIYRLPPGEYAIVVLQNRGAAAGPRPSGPVEMQVATFYPAATDVSQAQPIDIKGGDDLAGLDIQVRTSLTYAISGRVVSQLPAGLQAQNRPPVAVVTLLPHEGTGLPDTNLGSVNANADGTFEIRGVMPGSYDAIARLPVTVGWGPSNAPDRAQSPWAFGRASVDVGGANVDGLSIAVHQGVDITGKVTVDGKGMPAAVRVTLQSDDNNSLYTNFFVTMGNWAPFLESDGSFTLPLIPESRYRVRVGLTTGPTRAPSPNAQGQLPPTPMPLSPNAYVADVTMGGRSVYESGFAVTGDAPAPLEVVIRSDGGTVDGTVNGADGKPVPNSLVVLVPDTHRLNSGLYKASPSDAQGHFSMTRVPPGSYKAFAWLAIAPGAYESAEFLGRYESRGVPVRVASGSARVDLTVIR